MRETDRLGSRQGLSDPLDWCLVTGMARSGTTIVGDTLALASKTLYLHEPFSPLGIQGISWNHTPLRSNDFQPESEPARVAIEQLLQLRGRHGNQVPPIDTWRRRLAKRLIGGRGLLAWRRARVMHRFCERGVIKDPFAWRFCPWISQAYGAKVVVVVKHPVSQVASYDRAGWRSSQETIACHPAMMEQLAPTDLDYAIDDHCSDAIATGREWRWRYRLLGQWAKRYDWHVVRIEDMAAEPLAFFRDLFERIGWQPPARLEKVLQKRTGTKNPAEARSGVFQDLNRNSREIFKMRLASVPVETRRQVFEETFDVASQWYDEDSFDL